MSDERPSICVSCPLAKQWGADTYQASERYLLCGWQPKVPPMWWAPDGNRVAATRIRPKMLPSWRAEERCGAKEEEEERQRKISNIMSHAPVGE